MAYGSGYASGYAELVGGSTVFPAVSFEVAFASDPNAENPLWTDITADVRYQNMVETRRGRQRELDQYQAGTLSATLDNRDRDYDDQNTGSPHYPNVKPMKRVRVRAAYGGTTYPVFDGFVDAWNLSYENPREAVAILAATDAFKALAAADLASSVYAQEVIADGPVAWWRLDEGDNSADPLIAYDSVGDIDLTAHRSASLPDAGPTVGSGSLIARDPGASASFTDADEYEDGFVGPTIRVPIQGGPFTAECVVRLTDPDIVEVFVGQVSEFGGVGFVLGGNPPEFIIDKDNTGFSAVTSTVTLLADTTYHLAGIWDDAGGLHIYVNGVDTTTSPATMALGDFAVDGLVVIGGSQFDIGFVGSIDEVALYDSILTPTRIAAHAAAVTTPWNGDTPADRVERVLDAVDFPENLRSNDTDPTMPEGSSTLQPATLNMSALEHLRRVAASEFGDLVITRAGEVRLIGRAALTNRPELFTFTDDDPTTSPSYQTIGWDSSDQLIRNDVTISRNEGIAQNVRNQDSIDTYLRHSYTSDGLIHDSDALSRHAAEFIVSEYSEHKRRITQMTVQPTRNPAVLFPAVLGVELGDEVTVTFHPPGGGTFTQDSRIEGISHRFNHRHWETTFALSPAYADDFLELDAGPENAGLDFARLFF